MKGSLRRQTGFSQVRQQLQRHGARLVYRSRDEESVEALHRRLAQVPVETYRAERERFARRQDRFRIAITGAVTPLLSWLNWKT